MKKILGSILLLSITLFADKLYEWKVELSKNEPYLHEAVSMKMECRFSKEGKHNDIEFSPPTDVPFDFKLLGEDRKYDGEHQIFTYKYLIFAKKAGEYELRLKPQMLFITQSAIDHAIIGRDNVNDLEVEKETAVIKPLKIRVKPTKSDLTGDINLHAKVDLSEVSAYEPVHMEISIEGLGNFYALKNIVFNIEDVKVFSDKAEEKFVIGENGYKGRWTQRFAFVSNKSFTIPSAEIRYFDLKTKKDKVLKTQSFDIKIKPKGIKREDLIDKVNLPSNKIDLSEYLGYLYYLLSFIAGFIVAKLVKFPKRTKKEKKGEKIKQAKTSKELLEVLIMCDKNLFSKQIQELERVVYKKETVDISKMKKEALSML